MKAVFIFMLSKIDILIRLMIGGAIVQILVPLLLVSKSDVQGSVAISTLESDSIVFGDVKLVWLDQLIIATREDSFVHLFSIQEQIVMDVLCLTNLALLLLLLLFMLVAALIYNGKRDYLNIAAKVSILMLIVLASKAPLFPFISIQYPLIVVLVLFMALLISLKINLQANKTEQLNKPYLIAYASQMGTTQMLANKLGKVESDSFDVSCLSHLNTQNLNQYQKVIFMVSTYGEGEPPESAHTFVNTLSSVNTEYCVLAFGDSQYANFCHFGQQLYALLKTKGAKSFYPLVKVDRVNMDTINEWWAGITTILNLDAAPIKSDEQTYTVLKNICLNHESSKRRAHHIRLGNNCTKYEAGDLLAVRVPVNVDSLIARIHAKGWSDLTTVNYQGVEYSFAEVLKQLDWVEQSADNPQALVDQLAPISTRLYSIASVSPNYVDLLVREHRRSDGSIGNASGWLCNSQIGDNVKASIQYHKSFRLPSNTDVPIIMIAAGTGLAPFLAFLQQREKANKDQKNWLFFGEQYQTSDFYFKERLNKYEAAGLLTKASYAWSRDNNEYVQQKLLDNQIELKSWVHDNHALIYVCGKKDGFGQSVLEVLNGLFDKTVLDKTLQLEIY